MRALPRYFIPAILGLTVSILAAMVAPRAMAGMGPENVIVVVNGDSHDSRTVANHYVAARQIPASNVVVLEEVPSGLKVSLEDFKEKILQPILTQLDGRGLANQVGVIAYSAGFPTAVDVSRHTAQVTDENVKKYQRPTASITGMTFFYRFVLADDPSYLNWYSNLYARGSFKRHFSNPFTGDKQDRFEEAVAALEQDEPELAATIFEELFEEYSTLAPLAIRAAEAHASAGDAEEAKQWLSKGIAAGWWSAIYLRQSEPLEDLIADPAIAKALDRLSDAPITAQGPVGFTASRGWTGSGNWVRPDKGGMRYLLSCMLGVVHPRGSSVDQAVQVLQRSAEADRTLPTATVGFSKTGDVRTKTRFPNFGDAMVWLAARGRKTDVFNSTLPAGTGDYVGLVLGTANMDLSSKPWRLVPGAIAESLTSTGGAFETNSQTKLTELLHAGAAMSSGAVAEPYSLQFKFPLPIMHAYYAEGISAVEAFYLSVTSPYQLLIVGEPICQPFARPPAEMVRIGLADDSGNRVSIERESLGLGIEGPPTREMQIYVEGKLIKASRPRKRIQMNLPDELSGSVNLRVVLVGHDPTEPRLGYSETLDLRGSDAIPTVQLDDAESDEAAGEEGATRLRLECSGADRVELVLASESVGQVDGESGSLSVESRRWGDGPLRLRPIAHFGETKVPGHELVVHSKP